MNRILANALTAGIVTMVLAPHAAALKNIDGALIIHTNDNVQYTAGADYCGGSFDDPMLCEQAGTRSDKGPDEAAVVWVLAAFRQNSTPAVAVVYFSLDHDLAGDAFADWSFCGPYGSLEIPDAGWPATGGNSVAFGTPIASDMLFPVYWFALHGEPGATFGTSANPTGGYAAFVDDSNPPLLDPIHLFGTMRWGLGGENECPAYAPAGACCLYDGRCLVVTEIACGDIGGAYQGDLSSCSPNPCPPMPVGACCFDSLCAIDDQRSCVEDGGRFTGHEVPCDPNPCIAGGCCFADGHCELVSMVTCLEYDGVFAGAETDCAPNPCEQPAQACCFPNEGCTMLPWPECEAAGGNPQGPGTLCEQIQCRAPALGACCGLDGSCEVLPPGDCTASGRVAHAGLGCEPISPCAETPVERVSWGKLRGMFR
jgi:hypothetical protein